MQAACATAVTEQLTATPMTKRTKFSPAKRTESDRQLPLYYIYSVGWTKEYYTTATKEAAVSLPLL